jgi:hypothetical protein
LSTDSLALSIHIIVAALLIIIIRLIQIVWLIIVIWLIIAILLIRVIRLIITTRLIIVILLIITIPRVYLAVNILMVALLSIALIPVLLKIIHFIRLFLQVTRIVIWAWRRTVILIVESIIWVRIILIDWGIPLFLAYIVRISILIHVCAAYVCLRIYFLVWQVVLLPGLIWIIRIVCAFVTHLIWTRLNI